MIRFLHIVWAIIGIAVAAVLILSKGGHPPALVLLPVVAGAWLLGHIMLWISQLLVRRSSKSIFAEQTMRQRWPPVVVLVTIILGLTTFASTVIAITLFVRISSHNQAIPLAVVAAASAILFLGMLMRKNAARLIVIVLMISAATMIAIEMGRTIWKGYSYPLNEWLIASGIVIILLGLGLHMLKSKRVRMYFDAL